MYYCTVSVGKLELLSAHPQQKLQLQNNSHQLVDAALYLPGHDGRPRGQDWQ